MFFSPLISKISVAFIILHFFLSGLLMAVHLCFPFYFLIFEKFLMKGDISLIISGDSSLFISFFYKVSILFYIVYDISFDGNGDRANDCLIIF